MPMIMHDSRQIQTSQLPFRRKASCALCCVDVRSSRPPCPLVSFINLVTVCFFKNTGSLCPSVMLLVEREIGGIERVLFAVEKQIVDLDPGERRKPGNFMVQP